MERAWEIYTLTDPRTLRARYVGVTHLSESVRYRRHLAAAKRRRTHLYCWIRSLLRLGLKPIYLAIEYGHGTGWQDRERWWIAVHRKFCDLVNATDGGEGRPGYVCTEETRAKMSAAATGNRSRLGKKHSMESRAKMSAAQIRKRNGPPSSETRAKISAAMKGRKHSPETRAKISATLIGKRHSPEKRIEGKVTMSQGVSSHKITVNVFPDQPMDKSFRKTICEYHEYVEHVVGEYVLECAASCRDRRNISVRIGENGPWRDFSVCDHHADVIEQKLGIIEDGAVVGAEET